VSWREEAEHGEDERHHRHAEDLHAAAHRRGEEARVGRLPEDVTVHEFPARLLRLLLSSGKLIVLGNVAV
jgi:hypothetical protein